MPRIRSLKRAKKSLQQAKRQRAFENQSEAFKKSLGKSGDFGGTREFAEKAAKHRKASKQYLEEAKANRPLWIQLVKKLNRKAKLAKKRLRKQKPRKL